MTCLIPCDEEVILIDDVQNFILTFIVAYLDPLSCELVGVGLPLLNCDLS
jgi:hypothetical protein